MPKHHSKRQYEENWYWYLTGENRDGFPPEYEQFVRRFRRVMGFVPGNPRCFECNRPLSGLGSWILRSRPSSFSPRLCSDCERAIREEEAGAEVELSLLFADVRGSSTLAEQMTSAEYQQLIQRFYRAASGVLVQHDAIVNRLMGDQVIGLFVPRFAGSAHARVAVTAGLDLLRATGHTEPKGAWIPVGIGVHTGPVYVGAVGTRDGVNEIAVLGSAANLAARLSSQAAAGELLVSEAAADSAGFAAEGAERRELELKGFSQPVAVWAMRPEALDPGTA